MEKFLYSWWYKLGVPVLLGLIAGFLAMRVFSPQDNWGLIPMFCVPSGGVFVLAFAWITK